MGGDEVVEGGVGLGHGGVEGRPGGFDDLEEEIVLQLVDEMDHLGDGATRRLPILLHFGVHGGEHAASASHATSPGAAQSELDTFDPPQEVEDFQVLAIRPWCDDDVHRSIYLVFQSEDVPAGVPFLHLREAGIESAQDVGRVELGVRATDCMLELCCESMSILRAGGPVKVAG